MLESRVFRRAKMTDVDLHKANVDLADAPDRSAHGRLPQLDGLRGIAVLMVFLHHGTDILPIGWIGVHLFFVLSGFLITQVLWRAREDELYWGPFYIKRATRILPPLVPFFIACAFVVSINWKTTGLAYIFFGANIVQSLPNAPVTELAVLWSLAVEEHFYFIWPFAVRFLQRRTLIFVLVAILVVEPVARGLATHHVAGWSPIYQLTIFQLDGLAAGALLALLVQDAACLQWLKRYAGAAALLSGAVLAICSRRPAFAREQNSVVFNVFGYSLIVLLVGFALAYLFANGRSRVSKVLSTRPMIFVGAISYGLYLYGGLTVAAVHRALPMSAHHQGLMGNFRLFVAFAMSLLISWVSFRFYESHIVRWGRRKANALSAYGGRRAVAVQPTTSAQG